MSEPQSTYAVTYTDDLAIMRALERECDRLRTPATVSYQGPEPSLVQALLTMKNWSEEQVAEALRTDVHTVRQWVATGTRQSPAPFPEWYLLMQAAGVSGAAEAIDLQ